MEELGKQDLEVESQFDIAAPRADAMIHSLRAFGYELTTAIADLIDNSITAKAKNIWVHFYWDGEKSWALIKDDGIGMTEKELTIAMNIGSKSPLIQRDPKDLGRFGLGLKTASFSQCKRLTVRSKKKDEPVSTRCWDLDYVTKWNAWRLLRHGTESMEEVLSSIDSQQNGTIILWECLDRVVSGCNVDDEKSHDLFLERISQVKKHLSMVFHRYLEIPNRLNIMVNGRKIDAWNPFLPDLEATQIVTKETIYVSDKPVVVTPYVLPHHSKISQETHELAAGIKGWNAHQGFYVYRNMRMLVDGDWLNLGYQKEEHFKLARIQIDISNDMDLEWEIDVKKSKASPPDSIKKDLQRLAKIARKRASDIYRHRGKAISRQASAEYVYTWEQKVRHGKTFYSINRKHPLVESVLNISKDQKSKVTALLKLLEETVPVPLIVMNNAEVPDKQGKPFEGKLSKEVTEVLREIFYALELSGLNSTEATNRISVMEPFDQYPELVATFIDSLKGEVE